MSYFVHRRSRHTGGDPAIGLVTLAAGAVIGYAAARLMAPSAPGRPNDAPGKALRRGSSKGFRESTVVGRTVTVNRPRNEVYEAWRDFSRFPDFMENVLEVTSSDNRRAYWRVAAPGGAEIALETIVTDDTPGEVIAWKSVEGSDIANSGRVVFRDAPGNRGTQVEATIAYDPPAGAVGRLAAKLFQREPQIQARRELKRFKQLMETGEIAVADMAPAAPRAQ